MLEESTNYQSSTKKRYFKSGRKGIADFELLSLILEYSLPQTKARRLAKELFNLHGSLRKIFNQPIDELKMIFGVDAALLITLLKDCMNCYFEPEVGEKIVLSSPEAVNEYLLKYLESELGDCPREYFMVLCLNSRNELIYKEILFQGTIDQAQVYPREILKLALKNNAAAIICCHNHPSASPIPSEDDRILTKKLDEITNHIGLRVHDHLIVGNGVYSIKANRMISGG